MPESVLHNLIEVAIGDLKPGMYVAELDRPWLETPFLVQGFFVESQLEIDQLGEYCDVVYVDPRRIPDRAVGKLMHTAGRAGDIEYETPCPPLGGDLKTNAQKYTDNVAMKEEFVAVAGAYENASEAVAEAFGRVREGGQLDVPHVSNAVRSMVDSVLRNREALAALVRMKRKDDYIYSHCLATSVWSTLLGRHIGLDEQQLRHVALGAALIDVGKISLSDEILGKTSPLSNSEWKLMRAHVQQGVELVNGAENVDPIVLDVVRHHHERHDGSGYLQGLVGTAIPVAARIGGIADSYDAMITERPFAKARSSFQAMQELYRAKGTKFQAELVEQFMQAVGMFPTGTIVELNTGEVAIVVAQNPTRRLKPKVVTVLDANKKELNDFVTVDLLKYEDDRSLWIAHELETNAYGIDPQEFFV